MVRTRVFLASATSAARPTMVLPAPHGQDDDPRAAPDVAAGVERIDGHPLVVADPERVPRPADLAELDLQRGPLDVAGEVLGRVADADQRLLQDPPVRVVDGEARRVDPLAQVVAHPLLARQLLQQRGVLGDQAEGPVDPGEPDPAEAPDELPEVGRQAGGERELAVPRQRVDHRVGRDPRGRGVPEREGGEAIGVDMLRALLQLGEGCDRVAGLGVGRVVDLQEHRAVALHDQRVGGMVLHGLLAGKTGGAGGAARPPPCGSGFIVDIPTPARKVGLLRGGLAAPGPEAAAAGRITRRPRRPRGPPASASCTWRRP